MILVTGGAGLVGRHLVRQLVAEGLPVRVFARSPAPAGLPEAVAWHRGDLEDRDSLAEAVAGVEAVVHAAAALGGEGTARATLERVNVGGTQALAVAALAAGVSRFVFVGSAGVYGDGATSRPHREDDSPRPGNAYERSKLAAEEALAGILAGSTVRWNVLRSQGLYAADRPHTAALFREVARRHLWLHGPTRVVVHPTHVDDLVLAIRGVLSRPDLAAEVINVGGECALAYPELVARVGERVGRRPLQLVLPAFRWRNRAVDTGKARRLLAWKPRALESALDEVAAALSEARTRGS